MPGVTWTHPRGGMFVWFGMPPEIPTSPGSAFLKAAIKEGVLYIPGEFGYVSESGEPSRSEARLSFGDASPAMISEGIKRLRRAAESVLKTARTPVSV